MSEVVQPQNDKGESHRIYVIVSYVCLFFFPIISVILAYVKRQETVGTIYFAHIQFLLRTFWGGVIAFLLSFVLIPALSFAAYSESFGVMVFLAGAASLFSFVVWAWYLVRVIFGFIKALSRQPVKEKTWLL